jgi:PAS domain S-box-containing protein
MNRRDDVPALLEEVLDRVLDYAIFLLDPQGRIASWNAGAERIKGWTRAEVLGRHFSIFYPEDVVASGWPDEELKRVVERGHFEDEGWRVRKDGTQFWASVVITAVRGPDGTLTGFLKITRDLTERRRAEELLRQSEERFRLLVEGVKDYAIFMLDPTGHIVSWNQGAERIKGYAAPEILGRHFAIFYPPEDVTAGKPAQALEIARSGGSVEDEGWRMRKDGSRFWAGVSITAVHDHEGRLRGFAKVTRDLSERRRTQQLEDAGREMSQFLAMLSHELRNPLAPIRNAVGLLAAREVKDPTIAWAREVIDRQSALLSRLVEDLLDVTRIALGRIHVRLEPTDMTAAVTRAIEIARPLIEGRAHQLEVSTPREPLRVNADLVRLTQVIANLLTNAAKYTAPGGRIWLVLQRDGPDAVVRVRDNGMGIAADQLSHVFEIFTQGQRGLDRSEGGLGIGLTIARKLMGLHHGSVIASSEGPGRGSEFTVRMPLLTEPARAPAGETPAPPLVGEGRRVLVVDDNVDAATSLALLLELWGFETVTAHDGAAAVGEARRHPPHAVLLDVGLPGLDGYEVARQLRRMPALAAIPILAITGYGSEEDEQQARAAGFTDHLVKPVDADRLREKLSGLLQPA